MRGKEKKFTQGYEKYADAIYRHCYFRVSDKERAENLTQETFMKAWKYIQENPMPKNLRAFLYKIATNLIIDFYRKKKEGSLESMQEQGFQVSGDQHQKLEHAAEMNALLEKMQALDEEDRELIMMRYVDDLRPREIAKVLDMKTNLVSVKLHRAMQKLKKEYA